MRDFLERWYGDRCPPWTWPLTVGGIALIGMTVVLSIDNSNKRDCFAAGGNEWKARKCYSVTRTEIRR